MRFTYSDKEIQFKIPKKREEMWSRIQVQNTKPHWLQVDFDHFVDDEDNDGEDNDGEAGDALDEEQNGNITPVRFVIVYLYVYAYGLYLCTLVY